MSAFLAVIVVVVVLVQDLVVVVAASATVHSNQPLKGSMFNQLSELAHQQQSNSCCCESSCSNCLGRGEGNELCSRSTR